MRSPSHDPSVSPLEPSKGPHPLLLSLAPAAAPNQILDCALTATATLPLFLLPQVSVCASSRACLPPFPASARPGPPRPRQVHAGSQGGRAAGGAGSSAAGGQGGHGPGDAVR